MKKDDLIELIIEDLGVDGEGIGKVDGYTLFVKDAIGTGSVTRADGIKMCICPPVWRMSAAGHDL